MAGAALAPLQVRHPTEFYGTFPIKSAEVVNQGDLVGLDSNGQVVVATKTGGAAVKAVGVAVFDDENGMATTRTGVAGLTVKTGICRKCRIQGLTTDIVPSLDDGLPVYLGEVPDGTASNYTCAQSTTATDKIQQVGTALSSTEILVEVEACSEFLYQDAANTTIKYG